jgi:putative ABC transport system ATP-binding protein
VSETPVIIAQNLSRSYPRGRETVRALDGVSFEIARGEFVAITGPSGAGKSTLLNLLGCMDAPTTGTLKISGRAVQDLNDLERTRWRRDQIGFVFQHFGLIPTLTVAENIALPMLFARRKNPVRVPELLERVGLAARSGHRPHELSGGEMQRTAIARALVNQPALLLADEPTGNLDSATGDSIIALLQQLNADGTSIIVVTHNSAMSQATRRQIQLRDGRLV